mmetsp:Transcript_32078/g.70169  ORF Transcript_32078/g.70169 Transcript_32078/m.70169 type:complete len:349 (-) Transcript_32078:31-1077(-)
MSSLTAMQSLRRFRLPEMSGFQRKLIFAAGATAGVFATMEYKFHECIDVVGNPMQITSPHRLFWLRLLYGRARSRAFGGIMDYHVPVGLRVPIYRFIAWRYGSNLDEMRYPLDSFKTVNDFFSRRLAEGCRQIEDLPAGLVSPVDGEVLKCGLIEGRRARVEQVKGATYSVASFLGVDPVSTASPSSAVRYVVISIPTGNCHRIHSPCQVKLNNGRHYAGEFLSLREPLLRWMNDVFSVNERVVLSGDWRYGQMHVVAVAAHCVGNIFLDFDPKLQTNRMRDITVHCGGDVSSKMFPDGVQLAAGDSLGGFRLGSTVVLVFDAPADDFRWKVEVGDKVLVGQALGAVE